MNIIRLTFFFLTEAGTVDINLLFFLCKIPNKMLIRGYDNVCNSINVGGGSGNNNSSSSSNNNVIKYKMVTVDEMTYKLPLYTIRYESCDSIICNNTVDGNTNNIQKNIIQTLMKSKQNFIGDVNIFNIYITY